MNGQSPLALLDTGQRPALFRIISTAVGLIIIQMKKGCWIW
jgi:hypothetical protein